MEDRLGAQLLDDAVERLEVDDAQDLEVRLAREAPLAAGREVVDDDDLGAVGEQAVDDVRADEPGAAGDQCFRSCMRASLSWRQWIPGHASS